MNMSSTYLYVIGRHQGPVKIGISRDPSARLGSLQTGCPFKLDLLHKAALPSRVDAERQEGIIHDTYRDHWIRGEWFRLDADTATEAVECAVTTAEAFT
jgi:hypothetical protein